MRDRFMGKAIVILPVVQMIILVYAATFEIKNIDLLIVDRDGSSLSAKLTQKFAGSNFFTIDNHPLTDEQTKSFLDKGKADLALIVPKGFEKKFQSHEQPCLQILIDAVNGSAGELALAYSRSTILNFNQNILVDIYGPGDNGISEIKVSSRFWFNPLLDYKIYMAPGILVILITVIGWFMAGMNLVKEKEIGTIEQLNVSPIQKYQFLVGKLIPFLIIALLDLAFGLVLAKILYHVPFEGSLFTLFIFSLVYLITVLGIGLFISTISNTQQQVLFISFFFVMIFILMSGLFTAIENMPQWGQILTRFNPLSYFSRVIRMVLLKGSSIIDIRNEIFTMFFYGLTINILAVWRYRKTI
jgi:ABC-2 type transport system permease protein